MNEWKEVKLGDVCRLRGGMAFSPSLQGKSMGDFPFIKVRDFNSAQNSIRITGADHWVMADDTSRIQGRPFLEGTSVFAKIGEALKHNRVRLLTRPTYIDNNLMGAEPNREAVHPEFLFHALRTFNFAASNSGTAVPYITATVLAQSPVRIPPQNVQHRIASILGAYDDLIEVNRGRIALLEEMARRVFEEWFVRFCFPGHDGRAIVETPDGPLPEGWGRVRLDEVSRVNADTIRPADPPEWIGYVDIASVTRGEIRKIEWQSFADAPGRARRRVRDGSIIWSMVRPNRRSYALVFSPDDNMIVSTGFAVLDTSRISASFLYHFVTTDDFVGYLVGNTTGAAYPAVSGATFERAAVLLPPEQLDREFNRQAEPMLRLAETLRRQSFRLALSRDLLLPRLVSGELSVSTAERELEAVA